MSAFEYYRQKQQDSLQYQLEFGDVIERLRKYLEGYYWDEGKRTYIPYQTAADGISVVPLMSTRGINLVMRTLVALEHKGITLADLTPDEAVDYAKEIHRDLAKTLFIHSHEIGLAPADVRQITKLISITVYANLTRAIKGATAERMNKIVSVSEQKTSGDRRGPLG